MVIFLLAGSAGGQDIAGWQEQTTRYRARVQEHERLKRDLEGQWQILQAHPSWPAVLRQAAVIQARLAVAPTADHPTLVRSWFETLSEDERALLGAIARFKAEYDTLDAARANLEATGQRLEQWRQQLLQEVRQEEERIRQRAASEERERLRQEQERQQQALAAQQEAFRQAMIEANRQALWTQMMGAWFQSAFPPRLQLNCTTIRSGQRVTTQCY